jgi:ribosomal protein S18 acetylase RimI-like enzyme
MELKTSEETPIKNPPSLLSTLNFSTLTISNREILKILVNNCFPITYSEKFYKKLPVLYKDFARIVNLKGIPIGAIVCRIEEEGKDSEPTDNEDIHNEDQEKELKIKKKNKKNKKKKTTKEESVVIPKEQEKETKEKEKFLHLMIILVLEKYRRLGVAREIMQFVYKRVKEVDSNIKRIKLHVLVENIPAIEFYKKEGFSILETCQNHYTIDGVDKDALLMAKELI